MKQNIYFLLIILAFIGCVKDAEIETDLPILEMDEITNANANGVTLSAKVVNNIDRNSIIDFGFIIDTYKWSLKKSRTIESFNVKLTKGLEGNREYGVSPYIEIKDNFIIGERKDFINLANLAPSIKNMSPTSGYVGTTFVIKGLNLINDLNEANVIIFGGSNNIEYAEIISATNERIEFRIPEMSLPNPKATIRVSVLKFWSEILFDVVRP